MKLKMKLENALPLVACGVCGALTSSAAIAEQSINIKPIKRDRVYEFNSRMSELAAFRSQFRLSDDRNTTYVAEPLSLFERNRLRSIHTDFLTLENGAPENLLEDATIFRGLHRVSLCSNSHNEIYLTALIRNFPHVNDVSIRQQAALSNSALTCLKQLKGLKELELWCPLESPTSLPQYLPASLESFQFSGAMNISKQPRLRELRANNCRIDESFLRELDAPLLQSMYFSWTDFSAGAFEQFSRFKSLREIHLYSCHFEHNDLQMVRSLEFVAFQSGGDEMQERRCRERADKFFSTNEFARALEQYQGCVFYKPSAHGYLQMARCCIHLKNLQMAEQFLANAIATEPGCAEIDVVRREISAQ